MTPMAQLLIFITATLLLLLWLGKLTESFKIFSKKMLWMGLLFPLMSILFHPEIRTIPTGEPEYLKLAKEKTVRIPKRLLDKSTWYDFELDKIDKLLLFLKADPSRKDSLSKAATAIVNCRIKNNQILACDIQGDQIKLFEDDLELFNSSKRQCVTIAKKYYHSLNNFPTPHCSNCVPASLLYSKTISESMNELYISLSGSGRIFAEVVPYSSSEELIEISYFELNKQLRPQEEWIHTVDGITRNVNNVCIKNQSVEFDIKRSLDTLLWAAYLLEEEKYLDLCLFAIFIISTLWLSFRNLPISLTTTALAIVASAIYKDTASFNYYSQIVADSNRSSYRRLEAARELNKSFYNHKRVLAVYRRVVPSLFNTDKDLHQLFSLSHNQLLADYRRTNRTSLQRGWGGGDNYRTIPLSPENYPNLKPEWHYKHLTTVMFSNDYRYTETILNLFVNNMITGMDSKKATLFLDLNYRYVFPIDNSKIYSRPGNMYQADYYQSMIKNMKYTKTKIDDPNSNGYKNSYYQLMREEMTQMVKSMRCPLTGYTEEVEQ